MSEITKSLVRFQAAVPTVIKNKHVAAGAKQYNYADLAEIMNAIRPALSSCGLFLSQSFETNGATYLTTTIMHESGDRIESKIELPINGLPPQQAGSAITYYRRYSIIALLGIAAEDDDGKAAQDAGAKHGNSSRIQQLRESVSMGQQSNGAPREDHLAAEKYIADPKYKPFLKETPKGICWKTTAIQQAMRNFVHDLEGLDSRRILSLDGTGCEHQLDIEDFKGFLEDNAAALDACAVAMPNWYYGKQGSDIPGIEKRISDKRQDFLQVMADDPSKFLRA